jgi:hypothetical protein
MSDSDESSSDPLKPPVVIFESIGDRSALGHSAPYERSDLRNYFGLAASPSHPRHAGGSAAVAEARRENRAMICRGG